MKAKVILILALALLVAMPTLAMADDDRTITVTGKATLTVSADTAVIALSVETVKTTVSEATQENAARLRARGVRFVETATGELACGTSGPGRMAEPQAIFAAT